MNELNESPEPHHPKAFENPVLLVDEADRTRTTLVVDNKIKAAIERVHTKHGVLNTTVNILLQKLVNEFERLHITSYDPGTYERAVIDASICLGGYHYAITNDPYSGSGVIDSSATGEHFDPAAVLDPTSHGHELQRSTAPGSPTRRRPSLPPKADKGNVRRRAK